MRFNPAYLLTAACMTLVACAGAGVAERYQDQDIETRSLFLAYYPDLTPEQRKAFLDHQEDPEKLLEKWGIARSPLHGKPRNKILGDLKIRPRSELAVTRGTQLNLVAILQFQDGREVDVTQEVTWHVLPSLATMRKNALRFECASSDVQVTANFYNEREGSETYQIRKPLQAIEVQVAEVSQGIDRSDYFQMKVLARCQDGTVSDVTCQSELSVAPEVGKTAGCGQIQILSRTVLKDSRVQVRAQYGENSVSKWVTLPRRLPPRSGP